MKYETIKDRLLGLGTQGIVKMVKSSIKKVSMVKVTIDENEIYIEGTIGVINNTLFAGTIAEDELIAARFYLAEEEWEGNDDIIDAFY